MTVLDIGIQKIEQQYTNKIQYETIDNNKLIDLIKNETWDEVYIHNNPDIGYNIFSGKLEEIIKKAIIVKTFNTKTRKRKPWITAGIIKSMNKRDELHQRCLKNIGNDDIKTEYIYYRNKITNLVKKAKATYMKNLIYCTGNIDNKKIWEGVSNITNKTKSKDDIKFIIKNNTIIKEKQEMANTFNFHYANVGSNLAEKIEKSPPMVNADMNYTLFLHPTDETEIKKCITELKNKKAPGKDGIKAETIKLIVDYIVKPICFVFNNVLESGIYPDKLKIAVIKPLFKHGDKTAIENYRPISLISNFSKILEKIIKNRLTKYVSKHNIIAETQYGFQEHKSTNDAIAKLTSLMYDALDKSNPSLVVFLDLAKAFDTVSHSQLLQKLQSVGCVGEYHFNSSQIT